MFIPLIVLGVVASAWGQKKEHKFPFEMEDTTKNSLEPTQRVTRDGRGSGGFSGIIDYNSQNGVFDNGNIQGVIPLQGYELIRDGRAIPLDGYGGGYTGLYGIVADPFQNQFQNQAGAVTREGRQIGLGGLGLIGGGGNAGVGFIGAGAGGADFIGGGGGFGGPGFIGAAGNGALIGGGGAGAGLIGGGGAGAGLIGGGGAGAGLIGGGGAGFIGPIGALGGGAGFIGPIGAGGIGARAVRAPGFYQGLVGLAGNGDGSGLVGIAGGQGIAQVGASNGGLGGGVAGGRGAGLGVF